MARTDGRAHPLTISRALKEWDVGRTHFDGKTEPGLRAGEPLIGALIAEDVPLHGHPEKDVELVKTLGSSIRGVDQRALGKGATGTVSADLLSPPSLPSAPVQDTASSCLFFLSSAHM